MRVFDGVVCVCALLLAAPVSGQTRGGGSSCERLTTMKLANTTITLARTVEAGAFTPSDGTGQRPAQAFTTLPAFCRVAATLTPTADSDIKVEIWMPASGWNGKFEAVGNGGLGGTIPYAALAAAVGSGYAAAGTDTGHAGGNADFALGHPEKVIDHGYRGIHEMTVQAKAIIASHYGSAPRLSFFNGCSTGGRQGLAEAQRYPDDFNGIVAGASSWNQLRLHAARLALNLFVNRSADDVIPAAKYRIIHDAVLNACDALDGVKDGVIEDPTRCRFDYASLTCTGADGPDCLTKGQVESAKAMTSPITDPATGHVLYEGHLWPGSELGWGAIGGPNAPAEALAAMKAIVMKDPNWDYHRMQIAADVDRAAAEDRGPMYAGDPNLTAFFARGGRLLMYHGWADPLVTPQNSVMYYEDVVKAAGKEKSADSIELFMIPGMGHCAGGPGTDTFDKMAAIDRWVETGRPPASILASHVANGVAERTRPLCPYPEVAVYMGKGSTDEAAHFECRR